MEFEVVSKITKVQTFATSSAIRELARLRKYYGPGRWRKRKGVANVRLSEGTIVQAELHWYEANGIRFEVKIKSFLE